MGNLITLKQHIITQCKPVNQATLYVCKKLVARYYHLQSSSWILPGHSQASHTSATYNNNNTYAFGFLLPFSAFTPLFPHLSPLSQLELFHVFSSPSKCEVDLLQVTSVMVLCSQANFEDKCRALFNMFDFHEQQSLSLDAFTYLLKSCIYGLGKAQGIPFQHSAHQHQQHNNQNQHHSPNNNSSNSNASTSQAGTSPSPTASTANLLSSSPSSSSLTSTNSSPTSPQSHTTPSVAHHSSSTSSHSPQHASSHHSHPLHVDTLPDLIDVEDVAYRAHYILNSHGNIHYDKFFLFVTSLPSAFQMLLRFNTTDADRIKTRYTKQEYLSLANVQRIQSTFKGWKRNTNNEQERERERKLKLLNADNHIFQPTVASLMKKKQNRERSTEEVTQFVAAPISSDNPFSRPKKPDSKSQKQLSSFQKLNPSQDLFAQVSLFNSIVNRKKKPLYNSKAKVNSRRSKDDPYMQQFNYNIAALKQAKNLFDEIDADHSGSITIQELTATLEGNPYMSAALSAFGKLDADSSSDITFPELLKALYPHATAAHIKQMVICVQAVPISKKDIEELKFQFEFLDNDFDAKVFFSHYLEHLRSTEKLQHYARDYVPSNVKFEFVDHLFTFQEAMNELFMKSHPHIIEDIRKWSASMNVIALSEQQHYELEELFRLYDGDDSGTIEMEELIQHFTNLGFSEDDNERLFRGIDQSGDCEVDLTEFKRFYRTVYDTTAKEDYGRGIEQ